MGLKDSADLSYHESVKSINLCKSVIQTSYDIVKAHGSDPDSYREIVETKEGKGSDFIIQLPII